MESNTNNKSAWKLYFFSALIAFIVSYGVIELNKQTTKDSTGVTVIDSVAGSNVLYTADKEGNIKPLDFTETSKKVLDAVVHIKSTQSNSSYSNQGTRELPDPFKEFFGDMFKGQSPEGMQSRPRVGTGSGVIINDKGYIITNNHVIDNADEVVVTLYNKESYKATVIGTDPTTDLALLQIQADNLKTMALVNSDDVEVGEWVLAVGNPLGLSSTVTAGIVSAKARNIHINTDKFAVESFIQTDAAINPGNSGGALVNLDGNLVGINTAIASTTGTYTGYGFAVPSNIVTKVVEDLLKYGNVQRGMLGVTIRTMDGNLAKEKNVDFSKGVWVEQVGKESGADLAGIESGDIIMSVDGKETGTSPRLQEIIAGKRPGDKVVLLVNRNGKEKELEVELKNAEGGTSIIKMEEKEVLNLLGANFENVSDDLAKKFELNGGVQVTKLYPGKIKNETQMREGFIITHIDGKRINDVKDVQEILEGKKGGVMLEGIYEDGVKYYYAFGLDL
ncbi:Do family serine endopeptidase [Maribacter sp. ACAM166]|uniref:Do family serine endopeptidase n=1 Tax=Maribacter sp. ACAM166 TaxID=2508996 RepID=UPI0010FF01FD|nr:Do family serine endopeptidase [Maribacter sp. ACAM166]TLP80775.1 Do family serine endopeptidase [Maribacter sp. ACAM166]